MELAEDGLEDRFLVVLEPASRNQLEPTASTLIDSDAQSVALSIEDGTEPIVLALPRGLEPLEEVWYDYEPQDQGRLLDEEEADDWALHVVDGLEPGAYIVWLESGAEASQALTAHRGETTSDGLLAFHAQGRAGSAWWRPISGRSCRDRGARR